MTRATTIALATLAIGVLAVSPVFAQRTGEQPSQQQQRRGSSMLEDRVLVRLAEQAWVGGDFKVQAGGRTVTLSGTVPSEQTKERILRVSRRTFGVDEVRDQLRVDPSVASPPASTGDDNVLAQRVAQQIARQLQESAVTAFRALGLRDYARFDFRLAADGTPYLIEANPNPHLHSSSEFARAARAAGRTHPRTIREIVEHALRRYGVRA